MQGRNRAKLGVGPAAALSEVLVRTLRRKSLWSPSYQLQCVSSPYGAAESQTSQVRLEWTLIVADGLEFIEAAATVMDTGIAAQEALRGDLSLCLYPFIPLLCIPFKFGIP